MDLRKVLIIRRLVSHITKWHGGTTKKDYALTIDTAKEISMLQRTEKGKAGKVFY
jgi:phage anti-repressor protein